MSNLELRIGKAVLGLIECEGASDQFVIETCTPGVLIVYDTSRPEIIVRVERTQAAPVISTLDNVIADH